tara:strand:+ start:16512 stop:17234 length:723 start_codon:yes stop_codon:yes gene_type:complete
MRNLKKNKYTKKIQRGGSEEVINLANDENFIKAINQLGKVTGDLAETLKGGAIFNGLDKISSGLGNQLNSLKNSIPNFNETLPEATPMNELMNGGKKKSKKKSKKKGKKRSLKRFGGEPQAVEPQLGEPQAVEPQLGEPQSGEPELREPQPRESEVTKPEPVQSQDVSDPRTSEPEAKPTKKCGLFGLFCKNPKEIAIAQCKKRIREKYLLDMKKCDSIKSGGRKKKRRKTIKKKKRKNK